MKKIVISALKNNKKFFTVILIPILFVSFLFIILVPLNILSQPINTQSDAQETGFRKQSFIDVFRQSREFSPENDNEGVESRILNATPTPPLQPNGCHVDEVCVPYEDCYDNRIGRGKRCGSNKFCCKTYRPATS